MALFCKHCAKKYGQEPDIPSFLCEGCNKFIERKPNLFVKIKNMLQ